MKFVIDDNIPYIRGRLEPLGEVVYTDQFGFSPELVRDADVLVIRTRTRCDSTLLKDSNVKLIATATIGMDQIDLPWCAEAGIEVANSPGCNAPAVAQYVWSSLLRMGFIPGRDLLGVVGCGNVGSIVRDWGHALGCEVLVSDPPRQEAGIEDNYALLSEIMSRCDAVTLHTPLIKAGQHPSHHLIGADELMQLGDGKILINAARGAVVDFDALKPHAVSRRIRVAIDTWEGEPKVDEEILRAAEYGTFHIAGYSRQGKERATRMVLEAIERKYGVMIDKSGLAHAYDATHLPTAEDILKSYDPAADSEALKSNPELFDMLRRNYNYREEVLCSVAGA